MLHSVFVIIFVLQTLSDGKTINPTDLSCGLCRFLSEIKKVNGQEFPPKTLYNIVICVQLHLESMGIHHKLLDDARFCAMKFTLDGLMKERCAAGLGQNVCQPQVLTIEDENYLWDHGILGVDHPEQLVQTLLYVFGLSCALHAGKEHHQLKSPSPNSQFTILTDREAAHFLRYQEDVGLKTNKGGLKHRKYNGKVVNIYPAPDPARCPVAIFLSYNSKLPADHKSDALYLRPLKKYSAKVVCFLDSPLGINTLQKTV